MHSLLHITRFSRRGLHPASATVCMRESCAVLISRAYNAGAPSSKPHKTKEERRELVVQFVEKFKESHAGQFPGISLVRKEIGGGYSILKDIWQELEKEHHIHQDSVVKPGIDDRESLERIEHHIHQDSVCKPGIDDRESLERINVETGRNDGEMTSTAISIAMEEINLVAKDADAPIFGREKVDLVEKQVKMTGTAISITTEEVDSAAKHADSAGINGYTVEKEALKQEQHLVANVFDMSKSSIDSEVVDSIEPVKAMTEKENMEQKIYLAESQESAHSLVEPPLAEADDDSDLAAPEYNDPDQMPSIEGSLQNDRRHALRSPHFGLPLKFLPPSTTSADLIDAFKDCGDISKATVFPLRHEKSKHAFGSVVFKTAEGLHAARLKKKVFVKNVEVRLDNGFTKRPEYQDRRITDLKRKSVNSDSIIVGATAMHLNSNAMCGSEPATLQDRPEPSPKKQENWDSRNVRGTLPQMTNQGFSKSETTTLLDLSGMVSKLSPQEQSQTSARIRNPQCEVWVHAVPLQISSSEVHEAMAQFGDILNVSQQRGIGMNNYIVCFKNEAAASKAHHQQQLMLKTQWYKIERQANLSTTVVRISNLSSQVTGSKLRYACETIATVSGLEMRRKGMADVQFQVKGPAHIDNIFSRLSKLGLGEGKLKVCLAPRFVYGNDADKRFKPQNMQLVSQQRDTVIKQVGQNLEQLSIELQDFRELLALKRAEMFSID